MSAAWKDDEQAAAKLAASSVPQRAMPSGFGSTLEASSGGNTCPLLHVI